MGSGVGATACGAHPVTIIEARSRRPIAGYKLVIDFVIELVLSIKRCGCGPIKCGGAAVVQSKDC